MNCLRGDRALGLVPPSCHRACSTQSPFPPPPWPPSPPWLSPPPLIISPSTLLPSTHPPHSYPSTPPPYPPSYTHLLHLLHLRLPLLTSLARHHGWKVWCPHPPCPPCTTSASATRQRVHDGRRASAHAGHLTTQVLGIAAPGGRVGEGGGGLRQSCGRGAYQHLCGGGEEVAPPPFTHTHQQISEP